MDQCGARGSDGGEGKVIPFRGRCASAQDRLRAAAGALDAAMKAQCAAVAQWRAALSALEGNARALRESLGAYAGELDSVAGRVREAGDAARRLEGWADEVLAAQRGK
jgi:hypothetical protein